MADTHRSPQLVPIVASSALASPSTPSRGGGAAGSSLSVPGGGGHAQQQQQHLSVSSIRRAAAQHTEIRIGPSQRYLLKNRLGAGSFGDIYRGYDTLNRKDVAIKLELQASHHPQLGYESRVYKVITLGSHVVVGIPEMQWYGVEGDYNVMIIDLLGPNLEDLFNYCLRKFSLKTVCLLAEQMLYRLEHIHLRSIIHRDQKPENWVMGMGERGHCLYLIDFGLSKKFFDAKKETHIPFKDGKSLTGTARYCSVNAHRGYEQSRRDDLESMGFLLCYFINGSLPWQGVPGADAAEKTQRIGEKKMATDLATICGGHDGLFNFMQYCRELPFDAMPNYRYLRQLFRHMLGEGQRDFVYDWILKREKEKEAASMAATGSVFSLHMESQSQMGSGAPGQAHSGAATTSATAPVMVGS